MHVYIHIYMHMYTYVFSLWIDLNDVCFLTLQLQTRVHCRLTASRDYHQNDNPCAKKPVVQWRIIQPWHVFGCIKIMPSASKNIKVYQKMFASDCLTLYGTYTPDRKSTQNETFKLQIVNYDSMKWEQGFFKTLTCKHMPQPFDAWKASSCVWYWSRALIDRPCVVTVNKYTNRNRTRLMAPSYQRSSAPVSPHKRTW